eukprot:403354093
MSQEKLLPNGSPDLEFLNKNSDNITLSLNTAGLNKSMIRGSVHQDQLLSLLERKDHTEFKMRLDLDNSTKPLIPQRITASTRFILVLLEPEDGQQVIQLYRRYTNQRLFQSSINATVKDAMIYDPLDLDTSIEYSNGNGHLIFVLNDCNIGSGVRQAFMVLQFSGTQVLSQDIFQATSSWFKLRYGSVSDNMQHIGIMFNYEINGDDGKNYPGYDCPCKCFVKFFNYKNGKIYTVSEVPLEVFSNRQGIHPKLTFLRNNTQALIATLSQKLILVNVVDGQQLSTVSITGNSNINLGYYFDVQQYFLIDRTSQTEWKIDVVDNEIQLKKQELFTGIDQEEISQYASNSNAYQYAAKSKCAMQSTATHSTHLSLLDNLPFEFTMSGVRYSRNICLPNTQVLVAIQEQEPFEVYSVDMSGLDINYLYTQKTSNKKFEYAVDQSQGYSRLMLRNYKQDKTGNESKTQNIINLQSYLDQLFQGENIKESEVQNLQILKDLIVFKRNNHFEVYDSEKRQLIGKYFGTAIKFSDSGNAFNLHVGAFNYSVYTKQTDDQLSYVKTIPLLKHVAKRVDFLPGSDTQLVIFEDMLKQLLIRDIEKNEIRLIFKKVNFEYSEYKLVSDQLILIDETIKIDNEKVHQKVLYNIVENYPEHRFAQNESILDISLSNDKMYWYICTPNEIRVVNAQNFNNIICVYKIKNVLKIAEKHDQTYLLCEKESHNLVYSVSTLNPKQRLLQFNSSAYVQKQLLMYLKNEEVENKEQYIRAYQFLFEQGMINTYFSTTGMTFLHYLVKNHTPDLIRAYFENSPDRLHYMNDFNDCSPLEYAATNKKVQHLNIILEYFINYPERIVMNRSDFLTLMECNLNNAKVLFSKIFVTPEFYKCGLPYSITSTDDILVRPTHGEMLGIHMTQSLEEELNSYEQGEDEKVFKYIVSKFDYNFERGSRSSIEFLQKYADQDSEEVIRSDIRLIVQNKFQECQGFLRAQAASFMILLVLVFVKQIFFPESVLIIAIMLVLNAFFVGYEFNQISRAGLGQYFSTIWNYIDIYGFVSLFVVNVYEAIEISAGNHSILADSSLVLVFSLTIMALLLRGMSHLRIFDNLRYLINMVIEIMKDMSSFMILLIYWIFGINIVFFQLFLNKKISSAEIGEGHEEGQNLEYFLENLKMTYRLAFGDFSPDEYTSLEWLVFILSSVFIPLVLFNLIIAIMGDTYDRVQTSAKCVDLKEQANLVLEVEELMYWKRDVGEGDKKKILICFNEELSEDTNNDSAQWEGKIKGLQKSMVRIESKIIDLSKTNEAILSTLASLKKKAN